MDRINDDTATEDRKFREASGGTPATRVRSLWLNGMQEELASFIEAEGIPLSSVDFTQLRQALDSRFPKKRDAVTKVATITELRAMTGLVDGQAVELLGYNSAGDNGGGTLEWRSGDQSAEVAKETVNHWGLVIPPSSDPTGGSGAWFRTNVQKVTPYMFGCAGYQSSDDALPLQAFFDRLGESYSNNLPVKGVADWTGEWLVSAAISIPANNWVHYCGLIIASASIDTLLEVDGNLGQYKTVIKLQGTGSLDYSSRTCNVAAKLKGSSLGATFAGWDVRYFKKDGVVVDATGGSSAINANLGAINYDSIGSAAQYAGVNTSAVSFSYDSRSDTGSSITQKSNLTSPDMPAELDVGDIQFISDEPYIITDIDHVSGTLSVYPWITDTGSTSGTIVSSHGNALLYTTPNSAGMKAESVRGLRAGVVVRYSGLYGGETGTVIAEGAGVGVVIGRSRSDAMIGGHIGCLHAEATKVHVLKVNRPTSNFTISSISALDYSRVKGLGYLNGTERHPQYDGLSGVKFLDGSDKSVIGDFGAVIAKAPSTSLSNIPRQNFRALSRGIGSLTVSLSYDEDSERLFGCREVLLFHSGQSGTYEPVSTTVQPTSSDLSAGITVMGASSYEIPATDTMRIALFQYDKDNTDWRVYWFQATEQAALISEPSGGATVDTEARTAISALIDAMQANGLVSKV